MTPYMSDASGQAWQTDLGTGASHASRSVAESGMVLRQIESGAGFALHSEATEPFLRALLAESLTSFLAGA